MMPDNLIKRVNESSGGVKLIDTNTSDEDGFNVVLSLNQLCPQIFFTDSVD